MDSMLSRPLALPYGQTLRNRIAKAALTEVLADPVTHRAPERHCRRYRRWSKGGTSLLVTGGFGSRAAMEEVLCNGETNIIGLGRPLLTEPDAAQRLLASERNELSSLELSLRLDTQGEAMEDQERAAAKIWSIQGWFAVQMLRSGDGLDPDWSLSALHAFRQYDANERDAAERSRCAHANLVEQCQ